MSHRHPPCLALPFSHFHSLFRRLHFTSSRRCTIHTSFDLSREVVAVSLSLFDRYMAIAYCHNQQCNKDGNLALLCSLTTLQIAIKLHHPQTLMEQQQQQQRNGGAGIRLESLSRGQFDAADIERMEWTILSTLQWRLHAPTPAAFIAHYLHLLPAAAAADASANAANAASRSRCLRKDLLDLSRYLAELAVCDSYFCAVSNSTIALAAIGNVMEEMSLAYFPAALRLEFFRNLCKYGGVGGGSDDDDVFCQSPAVLAARERLSAMFTSTSTTANAAAVTTPDSPPPPVTSPPGSVVGSTSPPSVITDIHHYHQRQNSACCISSPSDLGSLSTSYDSSSSFSFYSTTKDSFLDGNNNNNISVVAAAALSTVSSHRSDSGSTCGSNSYRYSPFSPSIRRPYHASHHQYVHPGSSSSSTNNTKHLVSPCVAAIMSSSSTNQRSICSTTRSSQRHSSS
jgi:Cyclin, N-terminal domain/Cyclin, C-terminal domain